MPVDRLIGFNDLMPDKLEMDLIKRGDIPLTPLGLKKMRPDMEYAGASTSKLYQTDRSKASDPKSLIFSLPALVRTSTMIATFKAGNKRKTSHNHLFLRKEYTGDPYSSVFDHYSKAELLACFETGWGLAMWKTCRHYSCMAHWMINRFSG